MAVAVTVHGGRGSSSRWLGTERIYVDVSADVVIFLALKKTAWQQMRHTERARANIHRVTFDIGCFIMPLAGTHKMAQQTHALSQLPSLP